VGRSWTDDLAVGGAGFTVQALVFGILYSFGVVLEPVRLDLGASTATVALLPAVSACLLFFAGPGTGWLADRHGTQVTVAAGGVALAAGLWATSLAPGVWLAVAAYGILGGLAASLTYVPVVAHIAALPSARAPALVGVVVAGVGAGSAVAAPLLDWTVRTWGWRPTFRVYGTLALVGLSLAATVLARHRLHQAGPRGSMVAALRPLVGSRAGVRLYLAMLAVCPSIYMGIIFLPRYITDRGLSSRQAAAAAAVLAIASAAGRLVLSALGARIPPGTLFRSCLGLLALSLGVWLGAGSSYPALLLYAGVAGAGYGGTIGLAPTVTAERYGRDGLGAVLGGLYTAFGAGALVTGPAAGAVIDRWGYTPAFVAVGLLAAAATVLVPAGPSTPHPR
jgi:MFS family permease